MANVLFLGNCQVGAVQQLLDLDHAIYNQIYIPVYNPAKDNAIIQHISQSDIIITQPIFHKDCDASLENIIINKRSHSQLIIFPSCYMRFYYPDMDYLFVNGIKIIKPIDYHYTNIINAFKSGCPVSNNIDATIRNKNLLNKQQLLQILDHDLLELSNRMNKTLNVCKFVPNCHIIDIIEFIRYHYHKHLLFYSINHPTNFLLKHIVDSIASIINWREMDTCNVEKLGDNRCILYSCLNQVVEFDTNNHAPCLNGINDIHSIVQKYYDSYSRLKLV